MTTTDTIDLDLRYVTRAELIWLWRYRQSSALGHTRGRNGGRMTANEAATVLGFRPEVYCATEQGSSPYDDAIWAAICEIKGMPGEPSIGELCLLARRRANIKAQEICSALGGVSKPNFYSMERRGSEKIIALWRERGFTFPDKIFAMA